VARRGRVGALLGSGLVAMVAVGGVGGYGLGLLTTTEPSAAAIGTAEPLGTVRPSTPPSGLPTPTTPPRKVKYDHSPALQADELRYKTRTFIVKDEVRSRMSVRVPSSWDFTQPDPPKTGRFTDPTGKRWIRIESGFPVTRPPSASMSARVAQLSGLPADQMLKIISQTVDDNDATLMYSYVPPTEQSPGAILRYVVVRWVADETGNVVVEMSATGLPQDKDALVAIVDRATDNVERRDSPL
jgi:hypothetical protein